MKRFFFYLILIWIVWPVTKLNAQNIITVSSVEGLPDEEIVVGVNLANSSSVVAFQIKVPIPAEMKYISNSCVLNQTRINGHSISAVLYNDTLKIYSYSIQMLPYNGSDGELFNFRMKLGKSPGIYTLNPEQTMISDESGNKLALTTNQGSVKIKAPLLTLGSTSVDFGRVPIKSPHTQYLSLKNSGNVNLEISQIISSKTDINANATMPLTILAGNSYSLPIVLNTEKYGSFESDLEIISNSSNNTRQNVALKGNPYTVNEIYVANTTGKCDDTISVVLSMKNMEEICGLQTEIKVDTNTMSYIDGSFSLTDRKQNHICSASYLKGKLKLLAYSANNSAFTANEGQLATFKMRLIGKYGSYTLKPENTILSTSTGLNMCSDVYSGTVVIKSPSLYCPNTTVNFGSSAVTLEDTAYLKIYNYGNANLEVNNLVYTNPDFKSRLTFPLIIQSGQSYNIPIYYDGNQSGSYSGYLKIYSNNPTNRMIEVSLNASRYEPNILLMSDQEIKKTGYIMSPVKMENYSDISAVQFDITYPSSDIEIDKDNFQLTERTSGHSLITSFLNNNCIRVLIFSIQNKTVSESSGDILKIPIKARTSASLGEYNISISKVVLSSKNGINMSSVSSVNKVLQLKDISSNLLNTKLIFVIYPNPSNAKVYIRSESQQVQGLLASLYDITGKSLYRGEVKDNGLLFDLSGYKLKGLYLIQLSDKTGKVLYNNKLTFYY